MAQITLEIGGRRYELTVRPGQEEHFVHLGSIVDEKARAVKESMSGVNEARQLLMTALLLADEIGRTVPTPVPVEPAPEWMPPPELADAIDALAGRLERLAARSEHGQTSI